MKWMKCMLLRTICVVMVAMGVVGGYCNEANAQPYFYSTDYAYTPMPTSASRVHTEWGIGIGGVHTTIINHTATGLTLAPRIGFSGHLDMAVCIGRNFAIETEIGYDGGSLTAARGDERHRVKTRTVNIPVLLSLRMLNSRIQINGGPLFTVMSKADYTCDGEAMMFGPLYPTWNIAGGISIGLSRHLLIEARYIHGLKDNINQFEGQEFSTRTRRITAGVTLIF